MVNTISVLQEERKKFIGSSVQLNNEDKKTFRKKKHQIVYAAFLYTLENLEKQIQQKINKITRTLEEKFFKEQKQKLLSNFDLLKERVLLLQNNNEKEIFTFILQNRREIFNDINQKIKLLNKENFLQFLISVFEKIREKKIASKKNLENKKIKEVVDKCVDDILNIEAKNLLIKFTGWLIGVKIDHKNIFGSLISGLKEKVLFLYNEKERNSQPFSDEEMVTTFLRESLLPIIFFAFITLIFSTGTLMTSITIIGILLNEINVVKNLFSNKKKGALCNFETEEKKKCSDEISSKINGILKTPIEEIIRHDQFVVMS